MKKKKRKMENNEDRLKSILFVILIFLITSLTAYYIHYATHYYDDKLEEVCLNLDYNKITDYNKVHSEKIRNNEYDLYFQIECDYIVLKNQYYIKVQHVEACRNKDKWGDCTNWRFETIYSRPEKSYWLY